MLDVSVIVPIYNDEKYLEECLDSLINQTLKNIEIICVDDGSTDSSLEILKKYAEHDNRIIVLQQSNQGAGVARNNGLAIAKGEYLFFLDSDDVFELNMCELMLNNARAHNLDVLVCRSNRFDTNSGVIEKTPWTINKQLIPENRPFNSQDIQSQFFDIFIWWPWDKIYKKSYIDSLDIAFQSLRTTNDLFFVCVAVIMAKRIDYIDDILVHQRRSVITSLSVTREKSWDNFFKALVKLEQYLKEHNMYNRFKQDFINYSLKFSLWHLNTLKGYSYYLLYRALRETWFEKLSIINQKSEYFYSNDNYIQFKNIMNNDIGEIWSLKLIDLEQQFEDVKKKLIDSEKEIEILKRQFRLSEERVRNLEYERDSLLKSVSFRVGRNITWLPRKVRDLIK